jgi:energy-coupling factor transporter ATP-binding protein EcfA2
VADGAGCVLLPGQSGSGKTTLLASLLARGFDHVADDLVLVAEGEPLVQPLPLALVLKRGSWRILEGPIPALAALPVYRRAGQDVKYWLPPAERIARRPQPVKAIVFPRFGGAAALSATPLAAHDALMRMMQAPTCIGQTLSQASVDRLAGWMQSCPAYDLAYDRAEAAADWIAGLLLP